MLDSQMSAQAHRKNPGAFEVAVIARPTPSSHVVTEAVVSPPGLEAQYPPRPQVFIAHPASEFFSGEATLHENSPRFLPRNLMQSVQQSITYHGGSGGACEQLGPLQHEDVVGMLGDRIGSASDMSVASEKIYSGNSVSGDQYGERVKFMCSFGGKILPRPGDGKLRYAGGDTRIVSIYRHTRYIDLMNKMKQLYGLNVSLKYQLPNEDLDALISVSCDEDVENMMEEYDRLQTSDGSAKLRIFLFPSSDHDLVHGTDVSDERTTEKVYVDAINGITEFQGTRSISVAPTSSSSNLVGLDSTETRSTNHQVPLNMQHGVTSILAPHVITPMLGQPAPFSISQANIQPLPRILSASPSAPSSPTIVSNVAQVRQSIIPDISHQFYPDQLGKDSTTSLHGIAHQEMEGLKSGVFPIGSQHDISIWPVESRKATDSPTKAQYETRIGHFFHEDQSIMSDPHVATGIPVAVFPRVSSRGAMPRVVSQSSLILPQVQPLETGVISLNNIGKVHDNQQPTILHSPLELQNIVMQEQLQSAQVARQHGLETAFQKVEPAWFCPQENLQGIMRPPQQQFAPQYYTPIVTSSHEITGCNQLEALPGWLPPTNLAAQTSIHPSGVGVLHSGSTPSSPRLGIKDSNLDINVNMIQQYVPEQSHLKIAAQTQMELPMKGLKPLNTQVDHKDQLFCVDDRITRQNLPISAMKPQDKREGTDVQQYFVEGSAKPRVPPYVGGSPYRETLSPFVDSKSIEGGGQGQRQPEDGHLVSAQYHGSLSPFSDIKIGRWDGHGQMHCQDGHVYPQFSEGVDLSLNGQHDDGVNLALNRQLTEGLDLSVNRQHGWNQFKRLEKTDELNTNTNLVGINVDDSPSDASKSSLSNTGIGVVNLQKTSAMLTNTAETMPNLDPVTVLGFVQPLHLDGTSTFSNPLSVNASDDSKSLFAAKMEERPWLKGTESDIQTKNNVGRNLVAQDTLGTTENCFVDGSSGNLCDVKIYPKHDSSGLNIAANTQVVDPKIEQKMSLGASSSLEIVDSQTSPSSPHVSVAKMQMSRPVQCFMEEETAAADYLTEGSKYFHNQNLMSSVQNKEFRTGVVSFENVGFPDLRSEISSTAQTSQGKKDVPLFDSNFVQENVNRSGGSGDQMAKIVDEPLTSSLLYSVPTLSVQKWENALATVEMEDEKLAKDLHDDEKIDELLLGTIVTKISEIKVEEESDDTTVDETNKNLNLAAAAEAEAIARGLQTIKNADLEELRELGTGTFGTVYHGKWKGTDVAIKRIKSSCFAGRPSERERLIADFWNEAYMLGQLHHPNVVAFYGVVPDGPDGTLATVTEYMVNGSLKQVLQKKDRTIDRRKRLLIIMDAAFGMEYLHGKKIIHFDLKCENLLVNMKDPQRPICKIDKEKSGNKLWLDDFIRHFHAVENTRRYLSIGDLGLSKVKRQTMVSGGVRGTLPWMAPELLNGSSNLVSEKVDVFSFGIVMWELLTGEEPYADMHYGAIIGGIVNNTLRPSIPSWCDPAWKSLMEQCWATDPAERPSFVEIAAELRAMANSKS